MIQLRDVLFYTLSVLFLMTLPVYMMYMFKLPVYYIYNVLIALMFTPLIATLLTLKIFKVGTFKDFGVSVDLKLLFKPIVLSLVYPFLVIFTSLPFAYILGSKIDLFMSDYVNSLKQISVMEKIPFEILIIIILINLAIAPFINTIFAFGEEVGWRGYLYERVKQVYGYKISLIVSGSIWGIWHWPLIILFGYNYPNHPDLIGATLFLLFCIFVGVFLSWLKEVSKNVIYPSLAHGAINAYLGFGVYMVLTDDEIYGFPAGLPVIIATGLLSILFYTFIRKGLSYGED